jgi:hypothetical protein
MGKLRLVWTSLMVKWIRIVYYYYYSISSKQYAIREATKLKPNEKAENSAT